MLCRGNKRPSLIVLSNDNEYKKEASLFLKTAMLDVVSKK